MSENLEHILHDNGIHELIFHSEHREVVDEYFEWIENTVMKLAETQDKVELCFLLNFSQAPHLPPFAYLTGEGRKLLGRHLAERSKLHLRGASLARQDQMLVLSLLENVFKLLPIDVQIKPFQEHERENAMAWLLE